MSDSSLYWGPVIGVAQKESLSTACYSLPTGSVALWLLLALPPCLCISHSQTPSSKPNANRELPSHCLLTTWCGWHCLLSCPGNTGASPLLPCILQTHSTCEHSSRLSFRDICGSHRLSSMVCAFSYSAPGDLCCHLMKYIFRMLNMHINYPINGSDFLRAISLHCMRNISEGSEEKELNTCFLLIPYAGNESCHIRRWWPSRSRVPCHVTADHQPPTWSRFDLMP